MTSADLIAALKANNDIQNVVFAVQVANGDTVSLGVSLTPPDIWVSTPIDIEYVTLQDRLNGNAAQSLSGVQSGTVTVGDEAINYWGPYKDIVIFGCDDGIVNARYSVY